MKFCFKCGKVVKEEQTFCTSCGTDLKNETIGKSSGVEEINQTEETNEIEKAEQGYENKHIEENDSTIETQPIKEYQTPKEDNSIDESTETNTKLSKESKIVIAIVAVLIVAIVVIVQIGNSLYNPKKLETRFKNDIVSNNNADLASIMYCNDARLIVDSKNISPLLSYIKSHPSYYEEIIQNLDDDVLSPKNNSSIETSNLLTLNNIGKKFLIFSDYKISIKPSFVDITTPVKDVTFSINNLQIGSSDTDKSTKEFGPYIPGDYSILANYKGKYVTLNHPYPVDLVAAINGIAKLSVFDDMNYINITSDFPDAKIFVNGKDVNMAVADATNFGPIDSTTKIYATHMVDGKILKSQEYSVTTGGTDIYLSFYEASSDLDNVKNQLSDLLNYYTSSFTQAVNTNNSSLIDSYVTFGSALYKLQQSYIPTTYEAGIQESIVSDDITNYNISDDSQSGSITTSETYNIINKDGITSTKTFKYIYKFQYNGDTSSYQFTDIQKSLN